MKGVFFSGERNHPAGAWRSPLASACSCTPAEWILTFFQHSAEAAHRVSFEMGQVDHTVIVPDMGADDVVLYPFCILDGDFYLAFFVHYVHGGDFVVAALGNFSTVRGGVGAAAAIGRVAFHEGPAHFFHQGRDKLRREIVGLGRFSRGNLHGDASLLFDAEGFIDLDKAFRADFFGEIDYGRGVVGFGRNDLAVFRRAAAGERQDCGQGDGQGCKKYCGNCAGVCFHKCKSNDYF